MELYQIFLSTFVTLFLSDVQFFVKLSIPTLQDYHHNKVHF